MARKGETEQWNERGATGFNSRQNHNQTPDSTKQAFTHARADANADEDEEKEGKTEGEGKRKKEGLKMHKKKEGTKKKA